MEFPRKSLHLCNYFWSETVQCDTNANTQTEFKDCITEYPDDDWEEQRVGGPDENANN